MIFEFCPEKNKLLQKTRNISFEEIIEEIEWGNNILDIIEHSNQEKYPWQFMFIVKTKWYIYSTPFIKDVNWDKIFLKTIFPDRRLLKKYKI